MRRGLSLLEVLVSVFVLTLGLMGIAMTIPAGQFLMAEAKKADQASACGRAEMADFQIRGWDDAAKWGSKYFGTFGPVIGTPDPSTPKLTRRALIWGQVYWFDPWYCYANNGLDNVGFFPASASASEFGRQWPERALLRRVYFQPVPLGSPIFGGGTVDEAYLANMTRDLTTWREVQFSDDDRPRQMFLGADGENWAYPQLPSDEAPTAVPLAESNPGHFTWCAMISPLYPPDCDYEWDEDVKAMAPMVWDNDGNLGTPGIPLLKEVPGYDLSIVVFYKRAIDGMDSSGMGSAVIRAPEASLLVQFEGGGVGGGDVLLFAPGDGTGTTGYPSNPPGDALDVKKDQWILVKALDLGQYVTTQNPSGSMKMNTFRTVCRWYRVVTVDDVQPATIPNPQNASATISGRGRYVTLAGPDWQVDSVFDGPTGNFPRFNPTTDIAEAAIVDGVVGVYTTTVMQ